MFIYKIIVEEEYDEKFKNFLTNLNIVNSKNVVIVLEKKEIVAYPKEDK